VIEKLRSEFCFEVFLLWTLAIQLDLLLFCSIFNEKDGTPQVLFKNSFLSRGASRIKPKQEDRRLSGFLREPCQERPERDIKARSVQLAISRTG